MYNVTSQRYSQERFLVALGCCMTFWMSIRPEKAYIHIGLLVTWGKVVVFPGYSGFLHYLQLTCDNEAAMRYDKKSK